MYIAGLILAGAATLAFVAGIFCLVASFIVEDEDQEEYNILDTWKKEGLIR